MDYIYSLRDKRDLIIDVEIRWEIDWFEIEYAIIAKKRNKVNSKLECMNKLNPLLFDKSQNLFIKSFIVLNSYELFIIFLKVVCG